MNKEPKLVDVAFEINGKIIWTKVYEIGQGEEKFYANPKAFDELRKRIFFKNKGIE